MKAKVLILYSWLIRVSTFFLPDIPVFQRFRGWLYSLGMKKCGKRFRVSFNVVINHLEKIEVGHNVYLACGCVLTGAGNIVLGNDILVGPNVIMASGNHRYNGVNFLDGYEYGEIFIEDGVWIGGNASLLMNTRIHKSSLVGAGSVCNRDFEQGHVLIAGSPAKVIRELKMKD